MKRRIMRMLIILSVTFALATAAAWADSYWRARCIKWVCDTRTHDGLFRIKVSVFYARGGFLLGFTKENATTPESVRALLDYFQWHPTLEMWSERVEEIDAFDRRHDPSQTWRASYLPTPPSTLGFQSSERRGMYQGDYYWDAHAAIPFWFPLSLCSATTLLLAWGERRYRRQISKGLCPACKYDLRATPDRCPECGFVPAIEKVASSS